MTTSSIATTLGAGSGIDLAALVGSLVDAQSKVKNDALAARSERLTTQISAVSELKSGLAGFSKALTQLVNGGTLASAATSSDTAIATVKTLPGAHIGGVTASLRVRTLAAAQVAHSISYYDDKTAPIGEGTMTITLGTATVASNRMTAFTAGADAPINVTIDATNSSLEGIAAAINAANAGVTASIVTDSLGSRLALKGGTGAEKAFTIDVATSGGNGLRDFAVGINKNGTTIAQTAVDALVDIDGVAVRRPTNTITDLIPGVQIDLQSINTTKTITIGSTAASAAMNQAINDFVTTYNELKKVLTSETNAVSGSLRGDLGAQAMVRALAGLVTTQLVPAGAAGAPRTLAELGVGTNRDGTLSVNAATLTSMMNKHPATVEKILSGGAGATDNGLAAALKSISDTVTSTSFGLGASEARYTQLKSSLANEQQKALDAAEELRTRLTRQFASMDARVAAYKSTQNFLKNQVDAWNSNN